MESRLMESLRRVVGSYALSVSISSQDLVEGRLLDERVLTRVVEHAHRVGTRERERRHGDQPVENEQCHGNDDGNTDHQGDNEPYR